MVKILDWIKKNVKEDVKLEEVEKLLEESKLPETKEEVAAFIEKNKVIRSYVDSEITRVHDKAVTDYEEKKLPAKEKEIRDKLTKELNPEQTPVQKELAELKEWKDSEIKKSTRNTLEKSLMVKAKEIGFDPVRAMDFAAFGDDGEKKLLDYAKFQTDTIETKYQKAVKDKLGGKPPIVPGTPPAGKRDDLINQYNELEKSDDPKKAGKMLALKDAIHKIPKEE